MTLVDEFNAEQLHGGYAMKLPAARRSRPVLRAGVMRHRPAGCLDYRGRKMELVSIAASDNKTTAAGKETTQVISM